MCDYCVACCVCLDRRSLCRQGITSNFSESPSDIIHQISDKEVTCMTCDEFLCKFHWDEIVKTGQLINEYTIDKCQSCLE